MNPIVTVNVSQSIAPLPDTLQQMGAMISQGGTTLEPGTYEVITEKADLANMLVTPKAINTITWLAGIATATAAAPHGITVGQTVSLDIAGVTPGAYNGTHLCTATTATAFTFPLAADPGAQTVPGTYRPSSVTQLTAMVNTYFAQGRQQKGYILELGLGNSAAGVSALETFINDGPQQFYRYLVPRAWADSTEFETLTDGFLTPTSKTYFHVTVTEDNYTNWLLKKCVMAFIEAPTANPLVEFGAAWPFWALLHLRPSATNKVTPTAFNFGYGVTNFPLVGNGALLDALKTANVNWAGTGAEGGLSNTVLFWGTTMDGRDGSYWYSVDWVQINLQRSIAAAIMNGSNNPVNPLYYNQDGINRLQAIASQVMSSAVTFGLAIGTVIQEGLTGAQFDVNLASGDYAGQCVINAIPFITYVGDNPTDFPAGIYGGFAAVYTPARGFIQIIFNLNVTDFVAQ